MSRGWCQYAYGHRGVDALRRTLSDTEPVVYTMWVESELKKVRVEGRELRHTLIDMEVNSRRCGWKGVSCVIP